VRVKPLSAFVATAILLVGCGARTGLRIEDLEEDAGPLDAGLDAALDAGDAGDASDASDAADAADVVDADAAPPECVIDGDCAFKSKFCSPFTCVRGVCTLQPTPTCDDRDLCTDDRCDPVADACKNTPRTFDLDGDGFKGPLPGKQPGAADACGNDCDDRNAAVSPQAREICNGIDDNCDTRVDEDARYQVIGSEERLSPTNASIATVSGLTTTSAGFVLGYSAALSGSSRFSPYAARFSGVLARVGTDLDLTALSPSDGDGARAAWAGDRYGLVWTDRRSGNYEVYFALANASLQKLAPGDVRLTNSRGFSLNPSVLWTGRDFLVVWQEELGGYEIHVRRISADGGTVGPDVTVRSGFDSRNVSVVALPAGGYVLAWLEGSSIGPTITARVNVMRLDEGLVPLTGPVLPIAGTVNGGPALTLVDGKLAVAAHASNGTSSIVTLDPATLSVVATKPLTDGVQSFGRDVALLGVGQRLVAAWADDRDDQRTFEIYVQTFDANLTPAASAARVTSANGDSVSPVLAPYGSTDAVLVWNDGRNGRSQVYGRALQCSAPSAP
jgi:hypothetical protein